MEVVQKEISEWKIVGASKPMLSIKHPIFFRQQIAFTIEQIKGAIFSLSTVQKWDFLDVKSQMSGQFDFPTIGTTKQLFTIIKLPEIGSNEKRILIKVDLAKATIRFQQLLGSFLFKYVKDTNLEKLKQMGIQLKSIKGLVDYGLAETAEDIAQVIQLRKLAYGTTKKVNEYTPYYTPYDAKSKILLIKHQGKVIASARLFFPKSKEEKLEHQLYPINFPNDFPPNKDICEIMRVCTHPNYRKSDLLMGLFEFIGMIVIQQKRKFVLGCATKKLLPLYKKVGFKDLKMTYENKELNNMPHHLIMIEVMEVAKGRQINPISWNLIWGDMTRFLQSENHIQFSRIEYYWIKCLNALQPLSNKIYHRFLKKS